MRLVDLVCSAAPIVGVLVAALMAERRRLVRHYERCSAFGPESAVAAPVSRLPLTGWWRRHLRSAQVRRHASVKKAFTDARTRVRST